MDQIIRGYRNPRMKTESFVWDKLVSALMPFSEISYCHAGNLRGVSTTRVLAIPIEKV